jgi:hypothetical protein
MLSVLSPKKKVESAGSLGWALGSSKMKNIISMDKMKNNGKIEINPAN